MSRTKADEKIKQTGLPRMPQSYDFFKQNESKGKQY